MLGIPHTEYPISDFGIWDWGVGKLDKLWCGLPHFAGEARKHWPGSLSSWCGIFPLDAREDGAVGCSHHRMERW